LPSYHPQSTLEVRLTEHRCDTDKVMRRMTCHDRSLVRGATDSVVLGEF
jgi:hypothetical protein